MFRTFFPEPSQGEPLCSGLLVEVSCYSFLGIRVKGLGPFLRKVSRGSGRFRTSRLSECGCWVSGFAITEGSYDRV